MIKKIISLLLFSFIFVSSFANAAINPTISSFYKFVSPGEIFSEKFYIKRDLTSTSTSFRFFIDDSFEIDGIAKIKQSEDVVIAPTLKSVYFDIDFTVPKLPNKKSYDFKINIIELSKSESGGDTIVGEAVMSVSLTVRNKTVPVCIDGDGGVNSSIKAIVRSGSTVKEDSCLSEKVLLEYFCSKVTETISVISKEEHNCAGVCLDGACVSSVVAKNITYLGFEDVTTKPVALKRITDTVQQKEVAELLGNKTKQKSKTNYWLSFSILFLGYTILRYTWKVHKSEGGVSLFERLVGLIIMFGSFTKITLGFLFNAEIVPFAIMGLIYFVAVKKIKAKSKFIPGFDIRKVGGNIFTMVADSANKIDNYNKSLNKK